MFRILKSKATTFALTVATVVGLFMVTYAYTASLRVEASTPPPVVNREANPSIAAQVFTVQPITAEGQIYPGGGTGFLLDAGEKYGKVLITNRHVCESEGPATKRYYLRQGNKAYAVKLIAKSELTDLCMLEPTPEMKKGLAGLPLATAEPSTGDRVVIYGHPFLRPLTAYGGLFININHEPLEIDPVTGAMIGDAWMRVGRLDFMVFPGNSGSPVLNSGQKVVGVIFAMEGGTGNGLFVPLNDLLLFLQQQGVKQ